MKRASIIDDRCMKRKRVMDVVEYDDGHLELEYKLKGQYISIELDSFKRQLEDALIQFTMYREKIH